MAEIGLQHISAYHLTLDSNHFLHAKLPQDDFAWKQIQLMAEALEGRGFRHYEISNFGLPGFESKNNRNYWRGGPYLALGPSAHGFDGDRLRWRNLSDWEGYVQRLEAGASPREETEELSEEQRKIEVIFTSLRTSEGLDLEAFASKFGSLEQGREAAFAAWEKDGLGKVTNGHFVLSFAGRMLADEITRRLL